MISIFERISIGIKRVYVKSKQSYAYIPFLSITSSNVELLNKIKKLVGFGHITQDKREKNKKEIYIYQILGKKRLKNFLERFGNEITTSRKREKIKIMEEFLNENRCKPQFSEEIYERVRKI